MKKFIFRLESLLRLRKVREGCVKKDLELAHQKWLQGKEEETTLLAQIDVLLDEMHLRRQEGKFDLQETYSHILEQLRTSLMVVQKNLITYQRDFEEQQKRLQQSIQARKMIEKIKEKHYTEWRTKDSQMECSLIDELGCHKQTPSQ